MHLTRMPLHSCPCAATYSTPRVLMVLWCVEQDRASVVDLKAAEQNAQASFRMFDFQQEFERQVRHVCVCVCVLLCARVCLWV